MLKSGIFYQGPSMIDGAPIVGIAVWSKANRKTGGMLQTYILRADQSPLDAIRAGADVSICGDCKHRGDGSGYGSRSCYVNVGQGPTAVYKAFLRGRYADHSDAPEKLATGRFVRLGTYGDPAAIPFEVWSRLLSESAGHTGYTHQWRSPRNFALRRYCMASVDTAQEFAVARSLGWRTFRVRRADEPTLKGEFKCPASAEAGFKTQCADCRLCDGVRPDDRRKGVPVIIVHGALAKKFPAIQARAA